MQILKSVRRLQRTGSWLESMEKGDMKNFEDIDKSEANEAFLWAAFLGKFDLMILFESRGADVNYVNEMQNFNALHLCALNGSLECCEWLHEKGCSVLQTFDEYTPMHYAAYSDSKNVIEFLINSYRCSIPATVINCAVRVNAVECVKLLLLSSINVNSYHKSKTSLHLATSLRYIECMIVLLNDPSIDVNLKTRKDDRKTKLEKNQYTALHFAAEKGYADCIELLLSKQARINDLNIWRRSALHLACEEGHVDCVEILLKHGASVNEKDYWLKTPLHVTISGRRPSVDIVKVLVEWKAEINVCDCYGYSPLCLAAKCQREDCVNYLILNGADLTMKTTEPGVTALGMIRRTIPNSVRKLHDRLTQSLSHADMKYNKFPVMGLEFHFVEFLKNSDNGEMNYLLMLAKEGGNEILMHPLSRAFLYLKWQKVKAFYFTRILCLFLLVLLLSIHVVSFSNVEHETFNTVNNCNRSDNRSGVKCDTVSGPPTNCSYLKYPILILITFNLFQILFRETAISTSLRDYFTKYYNLLEITVIVSSVMICVVESHQSLFLINFIGPPVVLLGWIYLTVNIGQLPFFGVYITMFKKVFVELLKLILTYLCLLIGFTCTFGVLFAGKQSVFSNPISGFVKTIIMMTGEIDMKDEINILVSSHLDALLYIGLFILMIFVILITIVLMNLLIGIAVQDVNGLRKTADLLELRQQAELMHSLDLICFSKYLPKFVSKRMKNMFILYPTPDRTFLRVRPLSHEENRLPKNVMTDALECLWSKNKIIMVTDDVRLRLDVIEGKLELLEEIKKMLESSNIAHSTSSSY